jgi:hypothetical protein
MHVHVIVFVLEIHVYVAFLLLRYPVLEDTMASNSFGFSSQT